MKKKKRSLDPSMVWTATYEGFPVRVYRRRQHWLVRVIDPKRPAFGRDFKFSRELPVDLAASQAGIAVLQLSGMIDPFSRLGPPPR